MATAAPTGGNRVRDEYRSLTGPEKAAVFMLSLSELKAAIVFQQLDEEEIKEITQTMASLGSVSSSVTERLFMEFAEQMSSSANLIGSHDSTERLLSKIMDKDKAAAIMEEIRGPAGRTMWDKLGNVNEEMLANFLKNEYPQTVAVVLSKIRADHSARVLNLLPETFSMEVIMRMLRMEPVQKEVLEDVEKTLRNEFMSNLARSSRRDAHEFMAEIFNNFDRSVEARFMTALEERNRDAAERIKALMFTFEDLQKIDSSGIQAILRAAEKEKIPVAMKGASDALKDLFFGNMSERAAKIMQEDMASMGPVRMKDVDEAQQHIIKVAKDLAAKGEIIISDGGGADELIY